MHLKNAIQVNKKREFLLIIKLFYQGYKPKFAEPFSSKRHRDNEDPLPSSASIYGAVSPPYRQKVSSSKQHPSPSSNSNEHRPSPPPLLALPTRSLSNPDSSLFNYRI
jgi:hypothetical protein